MVALGIGLRLARYLLGFPLWGDEAMVAANFLDRGYADLARPLDYRQVCPLLFLWAELAVVELWGFHELALRLVPTLCSLASVLVFRDLAARLLRGWPLVLAVGIFAVSYYPIRHGAEVKAYASDLLTAVGLWWMAVRWLQRREQTAWLWGMAAVVPLCLSMSLTAIFVAAGVSGALLVAVWRERRRAAWLAYLAYNAAIVASAAVLYLAFLRDLYAQVGGEVGRLNWSAAFPPLHAQRAHAGLSRRRRQRRQLGHGGSVSRRHRRPLAKAPRRGAGNLSVAARAGLRGRCDA
jgi:hypothetical protein